MFYFETFENNDCNQIKTKSEPVPFIEAGYLDGQCVKNTFELLPYGDYIQYYCSE